METLKGKVAYITGGSKGIGLGIAEALLKQGMKVAITGRDVATLKEAKLHLSKIGKGEVLVIQSDVRNYESEQKAIAQVIATWGTVDVCIANAGVGKFVSIEDDVNLHQL